MQDYLSTFIEQAPSPQLEGLRYFIRAMGTVERFLGLVPVEARGASQHCIFLSDETTFFSDYQFIKVLFLGIETHLVIHDFLAFTSASLVFKDPCISAIFTYSIHLLRNASRRYFGVRNLARKSFLNQNFLSR